MNDLRLLVTGATGFLGERLAYVLVQRNFSVKVATRKDFASKLVSQVKISSIDKGTCWAGALQFVDCVIHCAAQVPIMNDSVGEHIGKLRTVNAFGTLNLAQQAAEAGVKRFIFISSIKVNGESTTLNHAFKYDDACVPNDPYGVSKYEAESGLKKIAAETGMEVVIIRPGLLYGPGVNGNFKSLINSVRNSIPLPLGNIKNKRSLVGLNNLVDLIITCIDHPSAANQTFLVSDDHDVSTTELLQTMGKAFGKKLLLIPVPVSILQFMGGLFGKSAELDRLCGSLQVDIEHTKATLNWTPPFTMEKQLSNIADSFSNKEA